MTTRNYRLTALALAAMLAFAGCSGAFGAEEVGPVYPDDDTAAQSNVTLQQTTDAPGTAETLTQTDERTPTATDTETGGGATVDRGEGHCPTPGPANGSGCVFYTTTPGTEMPVPHEPESGTSDATSPNTGHRFWAGADMDIEHYSHPDGEYLQQFTVGGTFTNGETTSDPCDAQSTYHNVVIAVGVKYSDSDGLETKRVRLGDVDAGSNNQKRFEVTFDNRPRDVEYYRVTANATVTDDC